MNKVKVSIYHDTRSIKVKDSEKSKNKVFDSKNSINNIYPVKLRVYYKENRKLYLTGIEISPLDFERSFLTQKPQKEYKEIKFKILEIEKKANDIIDLIPSFSFDAFERKMFKATGDADNVIYYYTQYIEQLRHEKRISTASNYDLSLKSILSFAGRKKTKEIKYIAFDAITPSFLNDYEQRMIEKGKKITTVGIYLRPLRSIFNIAKSEGVVNDEIYPFGKRKYQIPASRNIKKALSKNELKKLFEYKAAKGSEQERARDFWFLSYQCNGMNFRDIAELKVGDIKDAQIIFTRAKTKNTSKSDSKKIVVAVTDNIQALIKKYKSGTSKNDYLFPIFNSNMSAEDKYRDIKNFTRFVNQHLKNIAKAIGINEDISSYWARHSYSTMAIRNGASMEYLQESLGHADAKTTQNYFAGFEDKVKLEVARKLMEF